MRILYFSLDFILEHEFDRYCLEVVVTVVSILVIDLSGEKSKGFDRVLTLMSKRQNSPLADCIT